MAAGTAVFWYITVAVIGATTAEPKSGPYEIIISQLENGEDAGSGQLHFSTKIHHAGGGKHVYNSNFLIGLPVDEKFLVKVDVQQWSSQGYRPRAFTHTVKGCEEFWHVLKDFLTSFYKAAGVEVTGCPLPQGNFTAHDWEVEVKLAGFPVLPYNKYKSVLDFYHETKKIGSLNVYGQTVPPRKI